VWKNHRKAAGAILQEYVELLSQTANGRPASTINCAINVSLLRTFFFLIRNAFSIARRIFLSRPMNAAVMFAIAEHCAFEVDRLLPSGASLESEILTTKLRKRLMDITAKV
jgi:hypothetical protein